MTSSSFRLKERRRCANACSNCRRRKERCDGTNPCQRCLARGVEKECQFIVPYVLRPLVSSHTNIHETQLATYDSGDNHSLGQSHRPPKSRTSARPSFSYSTLDQNYLQLSARVVEHEDGGHNLLRNSSISALVQSLRQFAKTRVGDCSFVRQETNLPGTSPFDRCRDQTESAALEAPSKPDRLEADYLLQWYLYNPGYVYYLFEENILRTSLLAWLSDPQRQKGWTSCKFYLVLALGAQNCPEDKDVLAEQYYKHGRSLTLLDTNESLSTSIVAAQCYTLMTIYLLGSSRVDAAFMQLGQAIRAANALGLHRADVTVDHMSSEFSTREHLWKAIRVLDSFFSTLLGRPMATCDLRNTAETTDYSSTIDMCMIFERLITEVYTKQLSHEYVLQSILEHNRQWTTRFPTGLSKDRIQPSEAIEQGEQQVPNIGLIHIKHAFYGSIILLTQRPLVEHMVGNLTSLDSPSNFFLNQDQVSQTPLPLPSLGVVCIQSAIDAINLFRVLLETDQPPKRLPCVVSPIFYAGLVLGFATLGGYYDEFHLEGVLSTTQKLLSMFSRHDWLAKQYLEVFETLEIACQIYVTKRSQMRANVQKALVNDLVGGLDQYTELPLKQRGANSGLVAHNEQLPANHQHPSQYDSINTDPNTDQLDCWTDSDIDVPVTGLLSSFGNFCDQSMNLTPSLFPSSPYPTDERSLISIW